MIVYGGKEHEKSAENCFRGMVLGKRLGIDVIDIYWIHNPADVERWTPQLAPLLKSGKIKSVGVSNHNLAEIKRLETLADKANVSTIREWEKKME